MFRSNSLVVSTIFFSAFFASLFASGISNAQDFEEITANNGCPGCNLLLNSYRSLSIIEANFEANLKPILF